MPDHITYDPIYNTVDRDEFETMLEVPRYNRRTDAFDEIIAKTHDHFWDPMDSKYLDYGQPFDVARDYIVPPDRFPEFRSAVADKLDEGQKIRLANEITRWNLSGILHGEQGALSLSAGLCHILVDPGAQEYAANQAREEARHVTAFARYIEARWGTALPVGEELGRLLKELIAAPEVYKKLIGMQMLVEGLAMGAFASLHANSNDPLLKRLTQLVMTDEAFHHKFGKIWAERTIHKLTESERDRIEDWAAQCFETLLFNLSSIRQRGYIYDAFGLDWQWVRAAIKEVYDHDDRRNDLKKDNNIFRVLTKTLLKAGIITDRTRPLYSAWIDMKGLEMEGDEMVGDAIALEGIDYLKALNEERRVIGQKPAA